MTTRSRFLIRLIPGALAFLAVLAFFAWQLWTIQDRLSRNGAIATQLVESLRARFPGADFGGAASYESEVVYITIWGGLDRAKRQDVEQWLRRLKVEQEIAPAIWLRFPGDRGDEDTIKI